MSSALISMSTHERCAKRPTSYKITDIYQPKMNASVLNEFQERLAWWVYTAGMAFYKAEHHTLLEPWYQGAFCIPAGERLPGHGGRQIDPSSYHQAE